MRHKNKICTTFSTNDSSVRQVRWPMLVCACVRAREMSYERCQAREISCPSNHARAIVRAACVSLIKMFVPEILSDHKKYFNSYIIYES